MATVAELSEPYGAFMRNPLPPATEGVCAVCLRFTDGSFRDDCPIVRPRAR
jgi:hypothetical protein